MKADRTNVAGETLTIRLTADERKWLAELVKQRAHELASEGATVTMASFVRGLIKREATQKKIAPTSKK